MRGSKAGLLAGIALAGGFSLVGATQTWLTITFVEGAAAFGWLEVSGQQLNQSLSPIAIAALAAALALTIAGKVFRRVLGVLVALLGGGILAIALVVFADSKSAAASRIAEATGLAGANQLDLVTEVVSSPYILLTAGAGVALVLLGFLVLLLGPGWRKAGRKYEAEVGRPQREVQAGNDEPDRIADWESMNDGVDPSDDDPHQDSHGTADSR